MKNTRGGIESQKQLLEQEGHTVRSPSFGTNYSAAVAAFAKLNKFIIANSL